MVFTVAQTTAFFEGADQLGLTAAQRQRLRNEGLITVEDFDNFTKEMMEIATKNCSKSTPYQVEVVDPADATVILQPRILAVPANTLNTVQQGRLKIARQAYHYYKETDRDRTATNMHYSNVLKIFHTEWESIEALQEKDEGDVPIITKNVGIMSWVELFVNFLLGAYGVRKTPLIYVIRDTAAVTPEADDPLSNNKPYGDFNGSVLKEMINRYSHTHTLFQANNEKVYKLLVKATSGTDFS